MGTFVNKLLEEGKARLEDANKQALAAESNPVAQKRNVAIREPRVGKHGIIEDKPKDDFYDKFLADAARRKEEAVKRQQAAFLKPTATQTREADVVKLKAASSVFSNKVKDESKGIKGGLLALDEYFKSTPKYESDKHDRGMGPRAVGSRLSLKQSTSQIPDVGIILSDTLVDWSNEAGLRIWGYSQPGDQTLRDVLRESSDFWGEIVKKEAGNKKDFSEGEKIASEVSAGFTSIATYIAGRAIFGGATPYIMAAGERSSVYNEALEETGDKDLARAAYVKGLMISGTIDKIGMDFMLSKFPGSKWVSKTVTNFLKKTPTRKLIGKILGKIGITASKGLAEGTQETLQDFSVDLVRKEAFDGELAPLSEYARTFAVATVTGVGGSVVVDFNNDEGAKTAKEGLIENGFTEDQAEELITAYAESRVEDTGEMVDKLSQSFIKENRMVGLAGKGKPGQQGLTESAPLPEVEASLEAEDVVKRQAATERGANQPVPQVHQVPKKGELELDIDRGVENTQLEKDNIEPVQADLEYKIQTAKDSIAEFSDTEVTELNKVGKRLQEADMQEGDIETARTILKDEKEIATKQDDKKTLSKIVDLENAIEKVKEVTGNEMSDDQAFEKLRDEILPSIKEVKKMQNKLKKLQRDAYEDTEKKKTLPKSKDETISQRQYIKNIIAAQNKGAKAGASEKRQANVDKKRSVKEMQDDLMGFMKEIIPTKKRGDFVSKIKGVRTDKAHTKVYDFILKRAGVIKGKMIKAEKVATKIKIKKELKKTKTAKDKPGVTTTEFEALRYGMDIVLNNTQAENVALEQDLESRMNFEKESQTFDFRDRVTYALLQESKKGMGDMDLDELDATLTRLKETRKIARKSYLWEQIQAVAALQEDVDTGVEVVRVPHKNSPIAKNRRDLLDGITDAYSYLDIHDRGFKQIMNLMDRTANSRFFRDKIFQPVTEAHKEYLPEHFNYVDQDNKMFADVFGGGLKDKLSLGNTIDRNVKKMSKSENRGVFVDAKGNSVDLKLSESEMLDIYISSKIKANKKALMENGMDITMKGQKLERFYFSKENFTEIEGKLSEEAKKVGDYITDQVNDKKFMERIAKAYEDKFNKPFPSLDGAYWTLNRKTEKATLSKKDAIKNMFSGANDSSIIFSPNSFKERTESDAPIVVKDAVMKYAKWREDMLRFLHYDKAYNDLKDLVTNKEFANEFKKTYGDGSYKHFKDSLFYMANGGNLYGDFLAKSVNMVRSLVAIQHLAGRSRALVTQGGSALAAASDIPIAAFAKYSKEMVFHPGRAFNKMMSNPLVKYRHRQANFNKGLFEKEVSGYRKQGVKPVDIFMSPVKGGDMIGVIGAGYVVYKYNYDSLKETMPEADAEKAAMQRAENFILDTQQSSLAEYANQIMQSHPAIRTFGAYQQPTSMYRAKWVEAVKEFQGSKKTGKDKAKLIKQVATYQFVLPIVFELSKGNVNPYSLLSKTILSPVTGLMGYGKVIDYAAYYIFMKAIYQALGADDDDIDMVEPFNPFTTFGEDASETLVKAIESLEDIKEGEGDEKDNMNLLKGIGLFAKVPVKNLAEEYNKAKDVSEGDAGLRRLLETEYQYEQRTGISDGYSSSSKGYGSSSKGYGSSSKGYGSSSKGYGSK